MGAGALTICHNKTAAQVKEDMKKMVQIPMLRPRTVKPNQQFGVSLAELQERSLVDDGVPRVLRRMVEHLRKHGLHQEGLFRVNGNVRAVENLKQQLESGEDEDLLSVSDACTVASLLKQYLRDLPEGLIDPKVQYALIQYYQECGDDVSWSVLRDLLQQLPDIQHNLLRYLCHFLTLVESNHNENRMTALNLATVFGPNVFRVAPGFEAMKDQSTCNKIMVKLIQNFSNIFGRDRAIDVQHSTLIAAKEAHVMQPDTNKPPGRPHAETPRPVPSTKAEPTSLPLDAEFLDKNALQTRPRKRKVRKGKSYGAGQVVPLPRHSAALPRARPLPIPLIAAPTSAFPSPGPNGKDAAPVPAARQDSPDGALQLGHGDVSTASGTEALSSSQEDDRPISPFYMSNLLSPVHRAPDVANFLDRTIRSVVEQRLFSVSPVGSRSPEERQLTPCPPPPSVTPTARQRRRHQREKREEELTQRDRNRATSATADRNKENIPSGSRISAGQDGGGMEARECQGGRSERTPRPRKWRHSPTLVQLTGNQDAHALKESVNERPGTDLFAKGLHFSEKDGRLSSPQTLRMKIPESPVTCDMGRVGGGGGGGEVRGADPDCEDVPRLDLTALTEDSSWGEPIPAFSPLQRESMDREEARLSPHAGGRLIRQLLEEDSDPMLSPRFYAYGQCQQYLDDTEVPPSPPNSHSFVSRRRSSSLGSCDDEKEELTSAQLTKRIHLLKKKIHRFEERFEDERKYRPSHSDKAANPEVLRWVTELSKLRKELKEHKLLKSEEDLPPLTRQRSNTLPKSFGSQLEKKPTQEKVPKPPVESTLEGVLKKLQEKRDEVNRPEDIKDMTREQIGAEKLALQKALLYYEGIHGRPVTKSERQVMKPLYDRYRLVKQILCRASTIPVIGSPSSKRRGPLLQPIIEGETALFFDDIKEEEDGSEDDADAKTQFTTVSVWPDVSVISFLDHVDEEADGFISPVDELSPSKNTSDMRLSNLHAATTEELVVQLQEAREEKKRLRKNLKEFEDKFLRQNGRNVQKEDRSPLAEEYSEYKHVKAKLRLLEVLISKRDSSKFI
ncbi:protein FAM13A isoform X2 [Nelusetta ayraudi]|uniref:protein FAM13A isoform X2 n=1 Tax=Nelusetta ayraudi TaxID=303726 RepID=UPI003F72A4C5